MKVNEAWHKDHRLPRSATRQEKVRWHAEHAAACGCRPVPESLRKEVRAMSRGTIV
jgi:hypothetical protein